jgi:hypothetical protein
MLFALYGSADLMRVVKWNPNAINEKGDGCQWIMEALLDGRKNAISHLKAKAIG